VVEVTSRHLFDAYDSGDPLARRVFQICIEFWGMAAANLVSMFNPEKVIFGGGVFGPAVRFLDAIRDEARQWAQPISITKVSFEPSQLAGDAILVGAGMLALRTLQK
jgi:glucokinase